MESRTRHLGTVLALIAQGMVVLWSGALSLLTLIGRMLGHIVGVIKAGGRCGLCLTGVSHRGGLSRPAPEAPRATSHRRLSQLDLHQRLVRGYQPDVVPFALDEPARELGGEPPVLRVPPAC